MSVQPTDSQPQTGSTSSSSQTSVAKPTSGKPVAGTVNAARKKFEEMSSRPATLQTRSSSFREIREKTPVPPRRPSRVRRVTVSEVSVGEKPPRPARPARKTVTGGEAQRVASTAVAQFKKERPAVPPRPLSTLTGGVAQRVVSAVAEPEKGGIKKPQRPLPTPPSDSKRSSSEVKLPDSFYRAQPKIEKIKFLSVKELSKRYLRLKENGKRAFKVRSELAGRIHEGIATIREKIEAWLDPENRGKKFSELAPRSKRTEVQSYSPAGSAKSSDSTYVTYLGLAKKDLENEDLQQFLNHADQAYNEAAKMTHSHQKIEAYCEITKLAGSKYSMIAKQYIKECLELSESLSPREQLISLCKIAQVQMEFDILGSSETVAKAKEIAVRLPLKPLESSLQPLDQLELYASTFTLLRNPLALKPVVDDRSNFQLDTRCPKLTAMTSLVESELREYQKKAANFKEVEDQATLVDQIGTYAHIALHECDAEPKKAKQALTHCEEILDKIANKDVPSRDLIREVEAYCRLAETELPAEARESVGECEQFADSFFAKLREEVREKITAEKEANGNVPSADLITTIEAYCRIAGQKFPDEAKKTYEKCEQFVDQLVLGLRHDLMEQIEKDRMKWLLKNLSSDFDLDKQIQAYNRVVLTAVLRSEIDPTEAKKILARCQEIQKNGVYIPHFSLLEQVEAYCQLASKEEPEVAKKTLQTCEQFIFQILPQERQFEAFCRLALFEANIDLDKAKLTFARCEKTLERLANENRPSPFLLAQIEAYCRIAEVEMPNEAKTTLAKCESFIVRFFRESENKIIEMIETEKGILQEKDVSVGLITTIEACCRIANIQMPSTAKKSLNKCHQFVDQLFEGQKEFIAKNANGNIPSRALIAQIEAYCMIVEIGVPNGVKDSVKTCQNCFEALRKKMLGKLWEENVPSPTLIAQIEGYCQIARVNMPREVKETLRKCEEFISSLSGSSKKQKPTTFFQRLEQELKKKVKEEKRIPQKTIPVKNLVELIDASSHIALAESQKNLKETKKILARCERFIEKLANENVPSAALIAQIEGYCQIARVNMPSEVKETLGKCEEFVDRLALDFRHKMREMIAAERMIPQGNILSVPCLIKQLEAYSHIALFESDLELSEARATLSRCQSIMRALPKEDIPKRCLTELVEAYHRLASTQVPDKAKETLKESESLVDQLPIELQFKTLCRIALFESEIKPKRAMETLSRCEALLPRSFLIEQIEAYCRIVSSERIPNSTAQKFLEKCLPLTDQLPLDFQFAAYCRIALLAVKYHPKFARTVLEKCHNETIRQRSNEQITPHQSTFLIVAYCMTAHSESPEEAIQTLTACKALAKKLPPEEQVVAYSKIGLIETMVDSTAAKKTWAVRECLLKDLSVFAGRAELQMMDQIIAYCQIIDREGEADHELAKELLTKCDKIAIDLDLTRQFALYEIQGREFAINQRLLDQVEALCKLAKIEQQYDLDAAIKTFEQGKQIAQKLPLREQIAAYYSIANSASTFDEQYAFKTFDEIKQIIEGKNVGVVEKGPLPRQLPAWEKINMFCMVAQLQSTLDLKLAKQTLIDCKRLRSEADTPDSWTLRISMVRRVAKLLAHFDVDEALQILKDEENLLRSKELVCQVQIKETGEVINLVDRLRGILEISDMTKMSKKIKEFCEIYNSTIESLSPSIQRAHLDLLTYLEKLLQKIVRLESIQQEVNQIDALQLEHRLLESRFKHHKLKLKEKQESVQISLNRQFDSVQFVLDRQQVVQREIARKEAIEWQLGQLDTFQHELARLEVVHNKLDQLESTHQKQIKETQKEIDEEAASAMPQLKAAHQRELKEKQKAILKAQYQLEEFYKSLSHRFESVHREFDQLETVHQKEIRNKQKNIQKLSDQMEVVRKELVKLKHTHQKEFEDKQKNVQKLSDQMEVVRKELAKLKHAHQKEFEDKQKTAQKKLDQLKLDHQKELKGVQKVVQKLLEAQKKMLKSLQEGAKSLESFVEEGAETQKEVLQAEEKRLSMLQENVEACKKEVKKELNELGVIQKQFVGNLEKLQKNPRVQEKVKEHLAAAKVALDSLEKQRTEAVEALKNLFQKAMVVKDPLGGGEKTISVFEQLNDKLTIRKNSIVQSYASLKGHIAFDFQRSKEMIIDMRIEIEQQRILNRGILNSEEAEAEQAIAMKLQEAVSGLSMLKEFTGWLSPLTPRQKVHVFLDIAEIEFLLNSSTAKETLKEAEKFASGLKLQDRGLALHDINQTRRKFLNDPQPELLPIVPYLRTYHVEADERAPTKERRKSLSSKAKRLSMRFFHLGGN